MTTQPSRTARTPEHRSRPPLAAVLTGTALGVVMLLVVGARGEWGTGAALLGVMLAYSAVLLVLGRRSETVALLGGDVADERRRDLSTRAVAATGNVLVAVIVAMFVWELAHGRDTSPWAQLGGVGGATYVLATAWYAHRS